MHEATAVASGSGWSGRLKAALAIAPALASAAFAVPVAGQEDALEYAVKAAFIYKFGAFVEWPPEAFDAVDNFHLCVAGEDPFGPLLDRTVAGQSIGGRAIAVERMSTVRPGMICHMLFAGGSDEQPVPAMLEAVAGGPVLTFTDAALNPLAQGIVHFVILDSRVRFEIDAGQAAVNGLAISSKVLELAVSVASEE